MADFTGLNPLMANIARLYAAQGVNVPEAQIPQYGAGTQPITAQSLNPFAGLMAPPQAPALSPAVEASRRLIEQQMPALTPAQQPNAGLAPVNSPYDQTIGIPAPQGGGIGYVNAPMLIGGPAANPVPSPQGGGIGLPAIGSGFPGLVQKVPLPSITNTLVSNPLPGQPTANPFVSLQPLTGPQYDMSFDSTSSYAPRNLTQTATAQRPIGTNTWQSTSGASPRARAGARSPWAQRRMGGYGGRWGGMGNPFAAIQRLYRQYGR